MGREVVKVVAAAEGMAVVGAVDLALHGQDIGEVVGVGALGVPVTGDLAAAIAAGKPDVMVDFTIPASIMDNLRLASPLGVASVVGTTGLSEENLNELRAIAATGAPIFIAPNFTIGAVLMMQFAETAAKFFEYAEVIEFHHEKKLDAPSGTALRTADMMVAASEGRLAQPTAPEHGEESRGLARGSIRVHAVRMPGYMASQEVIFGSPGETLTIRHDSINRECYMPGVLLAVRKVRGLSGVVVGLREIM
jgi:4-hydroxy-tetrahydrodipicolinate reductase